MVTQNTNKSHQRLKKKKKRQQQRRLVRPTSPALSWRRAQLISHENAGKFSHLDITN